MNTTEWYSGDQKPETVGIYKRHFILFPDFDFYSWWGGLEWSCLKDTIEDAEFNKYIISVHQNLPWAVLTEENK